MKIKQGDYIELNGLTEDQHTLAAKAFISAGASGEREDEKYEDWEDFNFMVWNDGGDLMHYSGRSQNVRKLSLYDVIGQGAINWGGSGNKIAVIDKTGAISVINDHAGLVTSYAMTSGQWAIAGFSPDLMDEANKMNLQFDNGRVKCSN
jgi:hypothetical protein